MPWRPPSRLPGPSSLTARFEASPTRTSCWIASSGRTAARRDLAGLPDGLVPAGPRQAHAGGPRRPHRRTVRLGIGRTASHERPGRSGRPAVRGSAAVGDQRHLLHRRAGPLRRRRSCSATLIPAGGIPQTAPPRRQSWAHIPPAPCGTFATRWGGAARLTFWDARRGRSTQVGVRPEPSICVRRAASSRSSAGRARSLNFGRATREWRVSEARRRRPCPGPARGHYGRATPFFKGDAMTVGMPCRRPQGDDRNVAGRVIGEP